MEYNWRTAKRFKQRNVVQNADGAPLFNFM